MRIEHLEYLAAVTRYGSLRRAGDQLHVSQPAISEAAAGDRLATRRLLRIGTVNAGTASLVLPAVRAFQEASGRAAVEVRNLRQDEIHVSLAEGTLERAGLIVTRPLAGDTTVITMTALHRRQARVLPGVLHLLGHLREQARGVIPA
jgi:DNA-binding transcriptional LysR family regulator